MRHLAIDDMAARLRHFIPVHMLDRERRLGNGIAYRLIATFGGRSHQFDQLVSVCGHDIPPDRQARHREPALRKHVLILRLNVLDVIARCSNASVKWGKAKVMLTVLLSMQVVA